MRRDLPQKAVQHRPGHRGENRGGGVNPTMEAVRDHRLGKAVSQPHRNGRGTGGREAGSGRRRHPGTGRARARAAGIRPSSCSRRPTRTSISRTPRTNRDPRHANDQQSGEPGLLARSGAVAHFADNETKFGQTHKYDSLAQFDRNWNAQRNPQVYAGAMGAVSGQPASQWAKGLSDDEYKRALDIVSRASPSAVVNAKSGRISMQPQGNQGARPVAVQTPADAAALSPGTTYVTPDGRTFTR